MRKKKYFSQFRVVEVQQTFCKPHQIGTAETWREEAPADFEFTVKAWQLITHEPTSPTYRRAKIHIPDEDRKYYGSFKPTDHVFAACDETRKIVSALKAKLVLFQCPARFVPSKEHKENMRQFFRTVERKDLLFVWEPRGTWSDEEIAELCGELGLVHCVDPFVRTPVYGSVDYFRLHGRGGYGYAYPDDDLAALRDMCGPGRTTYCMFNNVHMAEDAARFKEMVVRPA